MWTDRELVESLLALCGGDSGVTWRSAAEHVVLDVEVLRRLLRPLGVQSGTYRPKGSSKTQTGIRRLALEGAIDQLAERPIGRGMLRDVLGVIGDRSGATWDELVVSLDIDKDELRAELRPHGIKSAAFYSADAGGTVRGVRSIDVEAAICARPSTDVVPGVARGRFAQLTRGRGRGVSIPLGGMSTGSRFYWFIFGEHRPDEANACWIPPFGKADARGYVTIQVGRRAVAAHRLALAWHMGLSTDLDLPSQFTVDHVWEWGCMTCSCVNPRHLQLVTPIENSRRTNAQRVHAVPNWAAS